MAYHSVNTLSRSKRTYGKILCTIAGGIISEYKMLNAYAIAISGMMLDK